MNLTTFFYNKVSLFTIDQMFRRQKWNLISRSQVSLEEASTSIDRALNATLSQLFSARNGSELSPEALTQLRFPPESEREVAKAAEIYERALQLVFERVKNAGDSIAEVTPKNFTYLDIISPGGRPITNVFYPILRLFESVLKANWLSPKKEPGGTLRGAEHILFFQDGWTGEVHCKINR